MTNKKQDEGNVIKFSKDYRKLPYRGLSNARLLLVLKTHYSELSEGFIKYDTEYLDGSGYYELPKTALLLLVFTLNSTFPVIFTTLRRWTPKKEEYYRSKQGELFKIEIKKKND